MTASEEKRTKVFVSYSHEDAPWLNRLKIHMEPLIRDGLVDFWDDARIRPGMDWRSSIREAISSASVAILLISADFLSSEFIASNELPPLLEAAEKEGALILPIILSPSLFTDIPSLSRFQSVNPPDRPLIDMTKGEQEKYFVKAAKSILEAEEKRLRAEEEQRRTIAEEEARRKAAEEERRKVEIFLAWSGERSKEIAECLASWLRALFGKDRLTLFFSTEIRAGRWWFDELERALDNSQLGILCMTPENLESYGIHYEAYRLLRQKDRGATVLTFLLERDVQMPIPLGRLNPLYGNRDGACALAEIVAKELRVKPRFFEKAWSDLERALEMVRLQPSKPVEIYALRNFESNIVKRQDNSRTVKFVFKSILNFRTKKETIYGNRSFPVFICGSAAIGKSTFARELRDLINSEWGTCGADILPTDTYSLSRQVKQDLNLQGYEPESHKLDKLCEDFKKLTAENGRSVIVRPYDHGTGGFSPEVTVLPCQVVIVEGVYSFYPHANVKGRGGLRVFIDAPPGKAMELKFAADVMNRSYTVEKAFETTTKNYDSYARNIRNRYLKEEDEEDGMIVLEVGPYWNYISSGTE